MTVTTKVIQTFRENRVYYFYVGKTQKSIKLQSLFFFEEE